MAGYSGTPLPQKLGIKEGMTLSILDAPDTFAITLRSPGDPLDITFVRETAP